MSAGPGSTREQRRAIVRLALILGAIALGVYLFTIYRGLW